VAFYWQRFYLQSVRGTAKCFVFMICDIFLFSVVQNKKEEVGFMAESRKALIICLVERQIVNWKTAEINYIHL